MVLFTLNLVVEGCQEQTALSCVLMLKVATQILFLESRLEMPPQGKDCGGWLEVFSLLLQSC